MSIHTTIVVPCYNEARRLPGDVFRTFVARVPGIRFLFVDDGSTDDTEDVLASLQAEAPDRFQFLTQRPNKGKAEAVRVGMLQALADGCRFAGYWDADLATPLSEIPRFIDTLETRPERDVCFGARVQLLGRDVHRRALRHYIGRLFATAASVAVRLPIYDTQCGAKLFRVAPATRALFAEPFLGRWTFDIEIIARLTRQCVTDRRRPCDVIYELALDQWHDIDGSNVRPLDLIVAFVEMGRIRRRYAGSFRPQRSFRITPLIQSGVRKLP